MGKKRSDFNLFYGNVGAIDGMFQTTLKPRDVPNPTDYLSGYYNKFGINVQDICDVPLRFIYVSTTAPGGKNDARDFQLEQLQKWLDSIGLQHFYLETIPILLAFGNSLQWT